MRTVLAVSTCRNSSGDFRGFEGLAIETLGDRRKFAGVRLELDGEGWIERVIWDVLEVPVRVCVSQNRKTSGREMDIRASLL